MKKIFALFAVLMLFVASSCMRDAVSSSPLYSPSQDRSAEQEVIAGLPQTFIVTLDQQIAGEVSGDLYFAWTTSADGTKFIGQMAEQDYEWRVGIVEEYDVALYVLAPVGAPDGARLAAHKDVPYISTSGIVARTNGSSLPAGNLVAMVDWKAPRKARAVPVSAPAEIKVAPSRKGRERTVTPPGRGKGRTPQP